MGSLPFLSQILSQQNEGEIAFHGRTVYRKTWVQCKCLCLLAQDKGVALSIRTFWAATKWPKPHCSGKQGTGLLTPFPSQASPHLGGILMISNHWFSSLDYYFFLWSSKNKNHLFKWIKILCGNKNEYFMSVYYVLCTVLEARSWIKSFIKMFNYWLREIWFPLWM